MADEYVILVDEHDNETGTMEKMEAHRTGSLHRAISVFIVNEDGEWLLQQRFKGKYHSGGLWTNACCSHPRPGETTAEAAHRRLKEEMGIECELKFLFSFLYRAEVGNDLIEHELDHVFIGTYNDPPVADFREADDWDYVPPEQIAALLVKNPEEFTRWFALIFERMRKAVQ